MNVHLVKSAKVALLLVLVAMSRADGGSNLCNENKKWCIISRIGFSVKGVVTGEYRNAARRGGSNMGLFPFPRVGRSDPSFAAFPFPRVGRSDPSFADSPLSEMHEAKRQGLIPFPRVGRSDMRLAPWLIADSYGLHKRNEGNNVNGGMWFGPRLGRLQKRSFQDGENPWTLVALKEPSFKQSDLVSRLSESEEDNDDTVVEEVLSRRMDSKSRNNISQQ